MLSSGAWTGATIATLQPGNNSHRPRIFFCSHRKWKVFSCVRSQSVAALQYNLQRGAQMAAQQNWVTASVITHNRELETRSRSEALGLWPTFSQPSACETFHTQKRCEMKREKKKKKIPSPSQFSNNLQTPKAQIDVKKKKKRKVNGPLTLSGRVEVNQWIDGVHSDTTVVFFLCFMWR